MTKDRDFVVERCQQLLADEIERLTKEAWETFEANGDLAKLITEKYVENERLRAENEGLREEVAILRTTEAADNDRLRAALQAIADRERPSTARSMARRALEPKP